MEWISFHGPRRPINGQKIIYYGEPIGVWRGKYRINYGDWCDDWAWYCNPFKYEQVASYCCCPEETEAVLKGEVWDGKTKYIINRSES